MFELFSEASKRAIFIARFEAGAAGGASIDSEHLLLGVAQLDPESLRRVGADASREKIRERAAEWGGSASPVATSVDMPITDDVSRIFERASDDAKRGNCSFVRTEHLLHALFGETACHAAIILKERGGLPESAHALMMSVAGSTDEQRGMEFGLGRFRPMP